MGSPRFSPKRWHFNECPPYSPLWQAGKSIVVCIEDHQYSPRNFWNGRWRSQWTVNINGNKAEVLGMLKVQVSCIQTPLVIKQNAWSKDSFPIKIVKVHYYEEGNVQLVSSKEVSRISFWLRKDPGLRVLVLIWENTFSQVKDGISLGNDAEAGKALVKLMKDSEEEYQNGISENYQVTNYAHT